MANFKAWVETTRAGNFLVRHRDAAGKKYTDEHIDRWAKVTINGKTVSGKNLANLHCDKVLENYHKNKLGEYDLSERLDPLVEQFLDERENRNLSPRTIIHDRISLTAFMRENNIHVIHEVTSKIIGEWIVKMRRRNLAAWTIEGRLADVRTFLYWLKEIGKIGESPFGKKLMPKRKQSEPRYYTTAEYKSLDERLADINPLTRLMCCLAHSAGLREAEMVGHAGDPLDSPRIMMEDISWHKGGADLLIRRELTKTNKTRTLPLDPGVVALLGSRRHGAIIPLTRYQAYHFFRTARDTAGINKKLTIHGLRHTFAKNYLQKGEGNLASLSRLMGHATIVSTMIYSQFEKAYLQEGVNRAYERRLVDENLAGQNVVPIALAGQKDDVSKESLMRDEYKRDQSIR